MTTGSQTNQSRPYFAGKVSLVPPRLNTPAAEQAYRYWAKGFISSYNIRPPAQMAESELESFLTHLTLKKNISASTHHQTLSAFLFLCRDFIGRDNSLDSKYTDALKDWHHQWVFLPENRYVICRTREQGYHHIGTFIGSERLDRRCGEGGVYQAGPSATLSAIPSLQPDIAHRLSAA
jgi:hypothetical protein